MPSPSESRAALSLVTSEAVAQATRLLEALNGSPDARRTDVLDTMPDLIGYFTEGTAALAADFYDDERELASAAGRFTAEPIIPDRAEKVRRGLLWATEPMFETLDVTVESRLAEVVQIETARGYRDTITTNTQRDPQSRGWERVASGTGCKMCRMLADRGAVYKEATAHFATHGHCNCSARPVFEGGQYGPEASAMQYLASTNRRTPQAKARLREYLNERFPDAPG